MAQRRGRRGRAKPVDPRKIVLTPDELVGLLPQPDLDGFLGYLHPREGARLAFLASEVPEGQHIVEVGAYKGKSACFLARGSKAGARVPVHSVDFWEASGQEFQRHFEGYARFAEEEVFETYERQLSEARVKSMVEVHKGASADVAATWGLPIGLLFVDADHHYDAVTADIAAWLPHLAEGGAVAFHDYWNGRFPGVAQAVHELVAKLPASVEVTRTRHLAVLRGMPAGIKANPPVQPPAGAEGGDGA